MLLKSRASLTCFRTYFLPGRAKDLSAPTHGKVQISRLAPAQIYFENDNQYFHLNLKKKLNNSSRLHVVEIARVPYMLPNLFPSWSG